MLEYVNWDFDDLLSESEKSVLKITHYYFDVRFKLYKIELKSRDLVRKSFMRES